MFSLFHVCCDCTDETYRVTYWSILSAACSTISGHIIEMCRYTWIDETTCGRSPSSDDLPHLLYTELSSPHIVHVTVSSLIYNWNMPHLGFHNMESVGCDCCALLSRWPVPFRCVFWDLSLREVNCTSVCPQLSREKLIEHYLNSSQHVTALVATYGWRLIGWRLIEKTSKSPLFAISIVMFFSLAWATVC